jgi:hypothetical protein
MFNEVNVKLQLEFGKYTNKLNFMKFIFSYKISEYQCDLFCTSINYEISNTVYHNGSLVPLANLIQLKYHCFIEIPNHIYIVWIPCIDFK